MCKFKKYKTSNPDLDKCIKQLISYLNNENIHTISSCCGHGKYHMTIVIRRRIIRPNFNAMGHIELLSSVEIPRTRRFYKRDKEGHYYIPEVEEHWRKKK